MFRLAMAGAQWRDRIGGAVGGALGIGITAWVSALSGFDGTTAILLAAPIGASAVLIFAVPSSPLAQPWRVIGGNILSALVGTLVAAWLGHGALAAGVAVGLAVGVVQVAVKCQSAPPLLSHVEAPLLKTMSTWLVPAGTV